MRLLALILAIFFVNFCLAKLYLVQEKGKSFWKRRKLIIIRLLKSWLKWKMRKKTIQKCQTTLDCLMGTEGGSGRKIQEAHQKNYCGESQNGKVNILLAPEYDQRSEIVLT